MQRVDYKIPTKDGGLRSKTLYTKKGRAIYVVTYKQEMRFKIIAEGNRKILVEKVAMTLPSMRQTIRKHLINMGVKLEKIYMGRERKAKVIKNLKIGIDSQFNAKYNKSKNKANKPNKGEIE